MKFIAIDGLDGSGKATQTKLLCDYFNKNNKEVKLISFPNYESNSSALIKMYLSGEFGENPQNVNPYAASTFYAVDRYASFICDWSSSYNDENTVIIADRYQSSNLIHQMVKLEKESWDEFISWSYEFEFDKLSLPKPDLTLYLDVPVSISQKLICTRYKGDKEKMDIHEANVNYLVKCRESALYAAQKLNWSVIDCTENDCLLPIEEVFSKIVAVL